MTRETTVRDLTLHIPQGLYRNLAGVVLAEVAAGTWHRIVWTSTDGVLAGGALVDGQETTYDLEE